MKYCNLVPVFLIAFLLFPIKTEAMSPGSALKKLRKKYRNVESLSADFREVFEWKLTGETVMRKGRLVVTGDNRFRIETPEQLLVCDGKDIYRHNLVKGQVIIEPVESSGNQLLPQKLLLDFADGFKADGLTCLAVAGSAGFRLDLIPDDPDAQLISSATLWVSEDDLVVHRLKLVDLNMNSTTYFLSNLVFDQQIDASETTYDPPEGIEVFDLR